jgi:hypothetical protein
MDVGIDLAMAPPLETGGSTTLSVTDECRRPRGDGANLTPLCVEFAKYLNTGH